MSLESNTSLPDADIVLTAPDATPAVRPSRLRRTFIGPDGLRAGWSLALFILLIASLGFTANRIAMKLYPPPAKAAHAAGMITPLMFFDEAVPFVIVLLVTWIMSRIERRSNGVYGLGGGRKFPLFLAGLFWGITCLSVLILALWKSGLLVFEGRMMFGSDILRWGAFWFAGFVLVGLLEEYLTRGYMQYTVTRGLAGIYERLFHTRYSDLLGFWTAAVLFSILFGMGHRSNPGESPVGLFSAGLAGMVFCYSLWRTGSLWWAIGFHASWDWGQSFLYGVADSGLMLQHHWLRAHPEGQPILSGGTTGPEGSIFILGIFALIVLIIAATLRHSEPGYPRGRRIAAPEPQVGAPGSHLFSLDANLGPR